MITKQLLYTTLCLFVLGATQAQVTTSVPVIFGTDGQLALTDIDLSGAGFRVHSPVTASDCRLDIPMAAELDIAGGTVSIAIDTLNDLSFSGGRADLKKNLYLIGAITGETDRSTFNTSSATISKTVILPAGHEVETGLGLTLTADAGHQELLVSRTNLSTTRRNQEGVARRYEFSAPVSVASASFHCRTNDLAEMDNPQLYYRHATKQSWDQVYESGANGPDCVTGTHIGNATGLTVFDASEIHCPSYFSPNGDGINDLYEVENSYRYPDSRLVVMTRRGKILYDKRPYRNDFDGGDLKADTYYFVFYKSADDKKPKKLAVDIIR